MTNEEMILRTARTAFAEKGFHQTGMAELAKRSQLSVGQIYRVFESKNDLIIAIISQEMAVREAIVGSLLDGVVINTANIEAVLEDFFNAWFANQDDSIAFDILAEAQRNAGITDLIHDRGKLFRESLSAIARTIAPNLREEESAAAEEFLFAILFGMGHRNLSLPSLSVQDASKALARMVVASVRALATN